MRRPLLMTTAMAIPHLIDEPLVIHTAVIILLLSVHGALLVLTLVSVPALVTAVYVMLFYSQCCRVPNSDR
jgi:hypothetical protein